MRIRSILICAVLLLVGGLGAAKEIIPQTSPKRAPLGDLKRGKYLVEEVAKCTECHTPRDAHGELDTDRWLQGAPIWIMPVHPTADWAERAPILAGFPAYSDEDAVNILEKGIGANKKTLRPPMHIYHLNHEDATAIVAYLRSLPSPRSME